MDLKEYQAKVIELLARHEETIAELYKTYAEKFPDKKQFWTALHLEELDHAAWVRRLHPKIGEGLLYFNETRFDTRVIQKSLDYLKELLSKARNEQLQLTEALSTGVDIEGSLIENKFFEVYKADSQELRQLLGALESAYNEHRYRLRDALDKIR